MAVNGSYISTITFTLKEQDCHTITVKEFRLARQKQNNVNEKRNRQSKIRIGIK